MTSTDSFLVCRKRAPDGPGLRPRSSIASPLSPRFAAALAAALLSAALLAGCRGAYPPQRAEAGDPVAGVGEDADGSVAGGGSQPAAQAAASGEREAAAEAAAPASAPVLPGDLAGTEPDAPRNEEAAAPPPGTDTAGDGRAQAILSEASLLRDVEDLEARNIQRRRASELLSELEGGGWMVAEPTVLRSGGEASPASPPPALRPEDPPPTDAGSAPAQQAPDEPQRFTRAGPHSQIKEMFHKSSADLFRYLRDTYPEWIEKGHVYQVQGKGRSVVIFSEKPGAEDPVAQQVLAVIDDFDRMDLEIEHRLIRPRYIDVENLMKALVMAGLSNVYELTNEADVLTWKEGNEQRTLTRNVQSYIQTGMVKGATAPIPVPRQIPFVYEVGQSTPFEIPKQYSGQITGDRTLVSFEKTSSTEERGALVAVGTRADIERIQAFTDGIDIPARQIMIEVQLIELDANKLQDFGLDSLQTGGGHSIANLALPLPGENIVQPGFGPDVRRDPEQFVPPVNFEGFDFAFDDTSFDLSGRFLTRLHWLVREGDATVKARPKILTLDDRTSVLHIGRDEPVFDSTGVTRDTTNGNIVNEIHQVTTLYVGFTLNIRPRITGGAADEVSLQMEVVVNELDNRTRVFEEDLAGIPATIKRHYIGMNRVKNHRPIILGGLIQEQDVENRNKIPLLADIPLLGYLFRRTQKSQTRNEVILIVTPHILSEKGVDPAGTPKESIHFDTFDSVLFNDRHIIKGSDVIGVDPIKKIPAKGFKSVEVVDLTLLNIVKKRELVSKLDILNTFLGRESEQLSWLQRRWPEKTVLSWSEEEQEIFFRAAAIVIENIKQLNEGLTFDEIVTPRREIVVPNSPYRLSLSYDEVKQLQIRGRETVFRADRVEVDDEVIALVRQGAGYSLAYFADFLEKAGRKASDHKDLLAEIERLYASVHPRGKNLQALPYPDVFRELDDQGVDFMTLATFFKASFDERYKISGSPDVGMFPLDLTEFYATSLSLSQRGRKLQELEQRWVELNTEDGGQPRKDGE